MGKVTWLTWTLLGSLVPALARGAGGQLEDWPGKAPCRCSEGVSKLSFQGPERLCVAAARWRGAGPQSPWLSLGGGVSGGGGELRVVGLEAAPSRGALGRLAAPLGQGFYSV